MAYLKRLHMNEGKVRKPPVEGQDARTGQFVKGNRLSVGRGRPRGALGVVKTYGQAVSRAVPPATLFMIIRKAVTQALGDGPHCDAARLFILKVLGVDAIRLVITQANGSQPGATYNLDALDEKELELLDQLSLKMTIEGGPDE